MDYEALIVRRDERLPWMMLGNNKADYLGIGDTHCYLFQKKIDILCNEHIKIFEYDYGYHVHSGSL